MAPPHNSGRLRSWLAGRTGAILLILVSAGITYAVGEHLLLVRIPSLMLGKWLVVEGKYAGSTVEFRRDGTMISTHKQDGVAVSSEGIIELDGANLKVTTSDNRTGKEVTDSLTILELSPQYFVTQDEQGKILIMKRAGNLP